MSRPSHWARVSWLVCLFDPVTDTGSAVIHANCVALNGRGLLILGASGAGKSSLSLELMSRGFELVADDKTCLEVRDGKVFANAPDALRGLIEARGIGILNADYVRDVPLHLVVDLDQDETDRFPPRRTTEILGLGYPVVHKTDNTLLPAALRQYMLHDRKD